VAFAEINTDFHHVLSGKESLTDAHIDQMYTQFLDEYKDASGRTPSHSFLKSSKQDRKQIFANKVTEIIEHNTDPEQTYVKGVNSYSDMTEQEFTSMFHIVKSPQHCSATHYKTVQEKKYKLEDIPNHWDWRDVGGVTPVKNQGHCGSCWTFSTVGCLEAHYLLKFGQFRNLSEQQLVDCAGDYDNHGCSGGLPSHAFEYIAAAGGLATEVDYPYMAVNQTCAL